MKRSQIILFIIFLIITGSLYLGLSRNKKETANETKSEDNSIYVAVNEAKNQSRTSQLISYGQVASNTELIVAFEVQGKLMKGDIEMKPGTNFKKGQLLYQLDNSEAFYTLSASKSALANLVLSALPDLDLDFPTEKDKWYNFFKALHPNKRLPELPVIKSDKEQMFVTSRNILTEYYNLKSAEQRMDKFFYFAPFSGTVIEIYGEPGTIVNSGVQLAKIAKTDAFEVKVPISIEHLDKYKNKSVAKFTDASGKMVGSGKIIRISNIINQQTQSADVYFSVTPIKGERIYQGMYLNTVIEQEVTNEVVVLPRTAVQHKQIQELKDGKINPLEITIVDTKPDSVFISGIPNGKIIVLDYIETIEEGKEYKGVKR